MGELETRSANFARDLRVVQDNSTRYFLFTHLDFSIAFNVDRIIEVNLTSEDPQPVQEGQTMQLRQFEILCIKYVLFLPKND